LVVLGFPSNDFSQEPDSNQKIADFCENTFGVKFPMFSKTSVTGNQAVPLFKQLAELTGTRPRWNFYKYVIARDGTHAVAFSSMTGPQDKSFVAEVEKQLSVKLPHAPHPGPGRLGPVLPLLVLALPAWVRPTPCMAMPRSACLRRETTLAATPTPWT